MHSVIVLVQCLRVNGLRRDWWIDLPELTSIQLGGSAFWFDDDDSTELIMRSGDDELNWWIDLPKLTSLTIEGTSSFTFCNPRIITLEGTFNHYSITSRHALSHHCHSWQEICFLLQDNRPYKEFLFFFSLISRHHLRSWTRSQRSKDWYSSSLPIFSCASPSPSWASYSSSSLWVLTTMILFFFFLSITNNTTILNELIPIMWKALLSPTIP